MDLAVCGLMWKHVDPRVEVSEGVTEGNNIHFVGVEGSPGDQEPSTAKSFPLTFTHSVSVETGVM